uniref:Uncharacterized protein n=1 Tax=Utricularia reniformis TaxID=192314 RepID=A0A1Y0B321_9LAMI|nr:hypothetical protein AEK19_MT1626 [Utricularia reniformis]ART31810.1 hypothetical protein AEK19_MT1626 [Utricularia reniformis]
MSPPQASELASKGLQKKTNVQESRGLITEFLSHPISVREHKQGAEGRRDVIAFVPDPTTRMLLF